MSMKEILRVVNRYIGVEGGYLVGFSYRTHADFYPEYCPRGAPGRDVLVASHFRPPEPLAEFTTRASASSRFFLP